MAQLQLKVWLPRVLFESLLIVISILLALALDEWQEDRELQKLVDRSVISFEREITQNKRWLDDIAPYHLGLGNILMELEGRQDEAVIVEFRNIVDGVQPDVLLDSAWQTSLASGALTQMDYELISALSLTYGMQNRFRDLYNTGLSNLLYAKSQSRADLDSLVFAASRYLRSVSSAEMELQVVYQQALEKIRDYRQQHGQELGADDDAASPGAE